MVPGGLLPAIVIDGKKVQTESLEIMMNLDKMFQVGSLNDHAIMHILYEYRA
jgi:glutathione S-transferase